LTDSVHIPVLLQEVLELLNPFENGIYVDGTLGGGGHTEAICRKGDFATVIAMDRDIEAIDRTERRLRDVFTGMTTETFPIRFVHANYRYVEEALDLLKIDKIDGFLLDLGLSSDQLADRNRGFGFDSSGELDLRFDPSEGESASELLARLPENDIADLIYRFGEEKCSRRIARRIVELRESDRPVKMASELAELVRSCVPKFWKTNEKGKRFVTIDPATRTFQAIRIAVNDELGSLENVLRLLPNRLKPGGVAAVISFHSLEDRIVKNAFRDDERWEVMTKKPITASDDEIERNSRSRSAKLRAGRRR
jgi:16S rRNA (cytosine1402-N4)-methyltransferase